MRELFRSFPAARTAVEFQRGGLVPPTPALSPSRLTPWLLFGSALIDARGPVIRFPVPLTLGCSSILLLLFDDFAGATAFLEGGHDRTARLDNAGNCLLRRVCALEAVGQSKLLKSHAEGTPTGLTNKISDLF